jgi:glycosyltransferase involved in cell wall biosynthesis
MNPNLKEPLIWLGSCGGWHLPQTALALQQRNTLAALWITNKNSTGIAHTFFRRCWPFHLAMKLFYHWAPQIWVEKLFYTFFPLWRWWLLSQNWPRVDVVQAIAGYASEPFDHAEKSGALRVVDCPNSHPHTYQSYWQRECDDWCPGEKIPVPDWMLERMKRELERADLVLCPSFFVRDTMVQNGISGEKCFVNPFGVDLQQFKPRSSLPEKPRYIAAGTICLRKGFHYLFSAFELVKKELPDAELIVVGDYKTDFRMQRHRWEGTFTHVPHLGHEELANLLITCSAFVFPSLEEGFARVIPEAMAAGLPIIASYESGATTLIQDGVEGIIVPPREPVRIAEAMVRLGRDKELNAAMGRAAYETGARNNSWLDYGDRLIAEYERRVSLKP